MPFALIGVALGLQVSGLPLSMPIWLGLIMLAGIVVNNAIVLVEYIEIERDRDLPVADAIAEAARLRLRPILMTTLTTVVGMLPLALGLRRGLRDAAAPGRDHRRRPVLLYPGVAGPGALCVSAVGGEAGARASTIVRSSRSITPRFNSGP